MRDSSRAHVHRRWLSGLTIAAVMLFAPACGSDGGGTLTTPLVTSVPGTWNLKTVNARDLPFTIQASDPKVELLARKYVIASNGTFTLSTTLRSTELDGTSTSTGLNSTGTYVFADNFVAFTGADGSGLIASVTATSMTIVAGTLTQVFAKE